MVGLAAYLCLDCLYAVSPCVDVAAKYASLLMHLSGGQQLDVPRGVLLRADAPVQHRTEPRLRSAALRVGAEWWPAGEKTVPPTFVSASFRMLTPLGCGLRIPRATRSSRFFSNSVCICTFVKNRLSLYICSQRNDLACMGTTWSFCTPPIGARCLAARLPSCLVCYESDFSFGSGLQGR